MKKSLFLVFVSFLEAGDIVDERIPFWVWILIGVFIVGIIIIISSSKKIKEILYKQEKIADKQIELDKNQSEFLVNLTEDINDIIKEIIPKKVEQRVSKESKIIDITGNLIEFLQLKANKITVSQEKFNLNNVLNEVSGYISASFPESNIDLIFDIENNVPSYIVGDANHLEKILINFLEHSFNHLNLEDENEVKVIITKYSSESNNIELNFNISDNGEGISKESIQTLYDPKYDDETQTYSGLGLFVSKELISLMNGNLSTLSNEGKGTTFNINIPFKTNKELRDQKFIIEKTKSVLLVDLNYNSSLAIKKMLTYFKYDVKIMSKQEFTENLISFSSYDIILLNESLFTINIIDELYRLKSNSDIKVISIHSLFRKDISSSLSSVIDNTLSTPLTQERVYELLFDLYQPSINIINEQKKKKEEELLVFNEDIKDKPNTTQADFRDFEGMNLLIVEDNLINQKIISNVLLNSGINITLAENGKIALEALENKSFDIVLMDINMPVMDGYETTKIIRSYTIYKNLPIIAFTALALVKERDKIFSVGMNAYLTKPIELGRIYNAFCLFYEPEKKLIKKTRSLEPSNILDFNIGEAFSGNNCAFYSAILQEFLGVYNKTGLTIEKLIRERKYDELEQLTLDLKGISSYIGAKKMFKLIFKINEDVKEKKYKSLVNYSHEYQKEFTLLEKAILEYLQ